ncbi:P-loop containing nucleoside triphosphate hydrolase protein [Colletotrichum zoysiae]|uniref:P-loop containing nucleoside triphosphate hydrolase protein n=1 Tax=Colletotrichum zoysiae TaxID=1216348 RepID=A0AAD9M4N7_9PEZI|nr:P-loop containing nucleoside triphosphate hydrolase protein [Colletotrichum zoysiae]
MDDDRLNSVGDESDFELGSRAPSGIRDDKDPMEMINIYDDVQIPRFLVKYIALGNFVREIPGCTDNTDLDIPGLTTELRPWQLQVVELISNFLRGPQRGAILGDGMGLGKTLTAIAVVMKNRNGPYQGPALVVAPKGLQSSWDAECKFHFAEDPTGQQSNAAMCKVTEAEFLSAAGILARRTLDQRHKTPVTEWFRKKGIDLATATPQDLLAWVERPGSRGNTKKPKGSQRTIKKAKAGPQDSTDNVDDQNDRDYTPEIDFEDDDYDDDDEYRAEHAPGRRGPVRQAWLASLEERSPSDYVDEPRVKAVVDTIVETHSLSRGDSVIVFSKYLCVLDILGKAISHKALSEKGRVLSDVSVLRFDGTMTQEARDGVRKQAEEGGKPCVILISAGAGGVGLTLTACNHVILAEPWWTRADELQAISRCYRQGQKKKVYVNRIVSSNSAMEL